MDVQPQIDRLNGETLALRIILTSLCDRLCGISPDTFAVIRTAFDDAASGAESLTIEFGEAAVPNHILEALRIIESMRAVASRDHRQPCHCV
jgi:hypothetical protein